MNIHYIDGEYTSDVRIPVSDLAVMRGYGIFDYTRTYNGRPFQLDAHLARLERSAQMIDLALPRPLAEIKRIALETLNQNYYAEASLRIIVTGGDSEDTMTQSGDPRLIVLVAPLPIMPESWYENGVKVITHCAERFMPEAKTLNYVPAVIALKKAQAQGAADALYLDRSRRVLEGTTTNVFAFFGDTLVTPDADVLRGVTREVVLEIAGDLYDVQKRDLTFDELRYADEVFMTSSNKEVCPISQVDDFLIGAGRPGAHTLRLLENFRTFAYAAERQD